MTAAELQAAIFTAVGPIFSGRLYPLAAADQPSYPYAVIEHGTAETQNTLCGRSDLTNYHIRIHVYSKTYSELLGLRDQVRTAMDAFGVPMLDVDAYEPEIRAMRRVMDFSVWRKE